MAISREMADQEWEILSLGALGRLELALGDLEAAGEYLRDLPERLLALGYNDPTAPVWPDAIEVLIGLGELERAECYLERYELFSRRVGNQLALAGAARCRGLLAAADGDADAACRALEQAVAALKELPYPLELGRTLLCLGSVHRKAQAEGRGARRAGAGRRDLRRARRAAVGGAGRCRAAADQRPAARQLRG